MGTQALAQPAARVNQFTPNAAKPAVAAASQMRPSQGSSGELVAATPAVSADPAVQVPIVQELTSYVESLAQLCSPGEKRQIQMVTASIQILNAKVVAGEVTADVLTKVEQMVAALFSRNFQAASAIQTVS